MNILKGKIAAIKTKGSLSLVKINVNDIFLNTIIIETPKTASYLKKGTPINVVFKETEVVIGKGTTKNLSLQNKVLGTILEIEKGDFLSKITIDSEVGKIVVIITTGAVKELQLNLNDKVTAMMQTTEIMLSE